MPRRGAGRLGCVKKGKQDVVGKGTKTGDCCGKKATFCLLSTNMNLKSEDGHKCIFNGPNYL